MDKGYSKAKKENGKTVFKIITDKNGIEPIISHICVFDNINYQDKNTDFSITETEDTDFDTYKFLRGIYDLHGYL